MGNRFRLLLCPATGQSISRIVQSLTVAHTWRYHRRHRSVGHVWQGRFKSPVIQDDDQLLTVLRYVEANPLRAGLAPRACRRRRRRTVNRKSPTPDPFARRFFD